MSATPKPPLIDIRPDHWAIVRVILHKHVPQYEVWAFGSRAKWTAKEYSDLDLAVITDRPLSISVSAALADDFSESDLPWKVDVVDWATTSESFRKIIERDKVVVQKASTAHVTNVGRVSPSGRNSTDKADAGEDVGLRDKAANPTYGIMAGEWRPSTWGDEISLEYGKALRNYDVVSGECRVFGSNGPIGWTAQPLAPGPGVILGRKGAYRGVQFSRDPFFVIDTAYYVVPKTELDMRWLYYAIKHYKLGEIDDGSPIPSTTRAAVYVRDLVVPPLTEQRAIAHILGTLDDKIELNRRMNETLEAIARAIFKSWFVDFDPVRAKASGEPPESICRRLGLTPDLLALFPDRLVDSELGEIPEGWEVRSLDTIALLSTASTSPGKQPHEAFEHYSIPAFDSGTMPAYELGSTIKSNKYVVSPNAVLVSKLNPETPRVWLPAVKTERAVCSTEFMQFVPLRDYGRSYLYLMMCSEPMQVEILKRVTGSTGSRQRAQPSQIATLPIVVPTEKMVRAFESLVTPVLVDTVGNLDQSQTLASLCDALLPKLLSGELRVPVA